MTTEIDKTDAGSDIQRTVAYPKEGTRRFVSVFEGAKKWRDYEGAHYNLFSVGEDIGMEILRKIFPEGLADEMNFVIFSTSGVHGSYRKIEEIEESLVLYPDGCPDEEEPPEDWCYPLLTYLVVHPRLVCLKYGNAKITLEDIPYLKKLRASSWVAMRSVGAHRGDVDDSSIERDLAAMGAADRGETIPEEPAS
jgi:hypothetical protein